MKLLHEVVIFVSNPFGFGPTGKTVALIDELSKRWNGKIVYAASSMCQETIPKYLRERIIIEDIDERDSSALRSIFEKYNHPFIISVLNRRAIQIAKSIGLQAFLVDSLAWMWDQIPQEYFLADTYYCFDLFNVRKNLPQGGNIKIIPPMIGNLPKPCLNKKPYVLMHIGGFKNPFQKEMPFPYLDLLVTSLRELSLRKKIKITGGSEALSYLRKKLPPNFELETYSRDEFLRQLTHASHFVTTPGLTATLEAFSLKTPTSFLPPSNLSQWKILKLLMNVKSAPSKIEWEELIEVPSLLNRASEQEAIPIYHTLAANVFNQKKSRHHFVQLFSKVVLLDPTKLEQPAFFSMETEDGCKIIINDLMSFLK